MKVAVSGTHQSGKSTLIEVLSGALPGYDIVDEPYHLLEAQGHQFATPPTTEDLELQLSCSLESIENAARDTLFERCPVDLLAYLLANDSSEVDLECWIPRVRRAVAQLALVIFVPLEEPDRMRDTRIEYPRLRRRVDARIRELLRDDPWELGTAVLEVHGTAGERARQVLAQLGLGRPHSP